jgi:hypothetical protein
MLVIRKEQMRALEAQTRERFEARLAARLQHHFPIPSSIVGSAGLAAAVRAGASAAARHGFTKEGDVFLFLSLACMFGSDFANDPQCAWAAPLLQTDGDDGARRIRACYAAAMAHLDRTIGTDNSGHARMLVRAHRFDWDGAWTADPHALLRYLHPRKYAELGEATVRELLDAAGRRASAYDLRSAGAATMFGVLMFLLGAGFDRDPLYTWTGELLRERSLHERVRLAALQQAALRHLARSLPVPSADMAH